MKRTPTLIARIARLALAAAVPLSLLAAAGCQGGNKRAADEDAQTLANPDTNLRSGVPQDAVQVGQEGPSPMYKADTLGRLYLYDRTQNRVVNSFSVRPGQELIVSGNEGRATLDGNEVALGSVQRGHTYVLYFLDPTNMGEASSSSSSTPPPAPVQPANPDLFRITPANR